MLNKKLLKYILNVKHTIIDDVKSKFITEVSRPTLDDYLTTLEKLYYL